MSCTQIPDFLYHYTTVESLICILKNKTIRFTPLSKMDDLDESKSFDLKHAGSLVYISSWTAENKESIPMWREYANNCEGVRIGLKANPFFVFANYTNSSNNLQINTVEYCNNQKIDYMPSLYPIGLMLGENGFISPQLSICDSLLHKIKYTDDPDTLFPIILKENNGDNECEIQLDRLGKYKNTFWEYQKEWRYIFFAAKFCLNEFFREGLKIREILASEIIFSNLRQPFDYLDLTISPEAFDSMEIILGPKMPYDLRCTLIEQIKTFNPLISISLSKLDNRI